MDARRRDRAESAPEHGRVLPPGQPGRRLALVLGAGNVSAIVPLDIADRLINGGQVVICKMNPVNDYLGPIFEDIFAPLTRDRYLAFASTARRGRARGRIASRALADFGAGERHYLCGEPPDLLGRFLFEDQVDGVEPLSGGELGDDPGPGGRGGADRLGTGARAGAAGGVGLWVPFWNPTRFSTGGPAAGASAAACPASPAGTTARVLAVAPSG